MYTVGSSGSTVEKSAYENMSILPVLYLRLPHDGFAFKSISWVAPSGATGTDYFDDLGPDSNRDSWVSPSHWNTIREYGVWKINASYLYSGKVLDFGGSAYSFQVNPEPASVLLFLLGALAFGLHYFLKIRARA